MADRARRRASGQSTRVVEDYPQPPEPQPPAGRRLPANNRRQPPEGTGANVGRIYAINTLGAILGAILGGFVLLPFLGTTQDMSRE